MAWDTRSLKKRGKNSVFIEENTASSVSSRILKFPKIFLPHSKEGDELCYFTKVEEEYRRLNYLIVTAFLLCVRDMATDRHVKRPGCL